MTELRVVGGDLLPPPDERRHLLSIADLGRDDVERLLATARSFALSQARESKKLPTLRGRLVINVFFESSTRTSASFELAAKRLSADTLSLKSSGSSVDKGESLKDTVLTLAQYDPHAIVVRHPQIGAPQLAACYSDAAVVNAGDGKHQHPTQALLDLFTMRQALEPAERLLDGVQVEQRLGWMLMLAVAGVHDVRVGDARDELRRADLRVAQDDHVWVVGRERQRRVLERLALVDRRARRLQGHRVG